MWFKTISLSSSSAGILRTISSYSKECIDSPSAPYELFHQLKWLCCLTFLKKMSFLVTWLFWFYHFLWYIISWCKDTKTPINGCVRINLQYASLQQLCSVVLFFPCFNHLSLNPFTNNSLLLLITPVWFMLITNFMHFMRLVWHSKKICFPSFR